MANATVSVIIPTYNGEKYLGEALASVEAQTYPGIEVIVVDDGSTDASAAIAESFAGATVIRQPNQGVSAARNRGIAEATGELLAFLDQDDLHHPEKTARQVEALQRDAEAGFALCHKRYLLESKPPAWFRGPRDGTPVPGFVPSCWLVRRDTFDRVGTFDERFRTGGDSEWLARAKDLGVHYSMLEETLVTYRVHDDNASHDSTTMRRELLQLLRESVHRQGRS